MRVPIVFVVLLVGVNSLPQLLPGFPQIPGIPGIPQIPGIPGLPQLPGIPGLPKLPQIPGLPGIPGLSNVEIGYPDNDDAEDDDDPYASRIVAGWPAKLGQFPYQARSRARLDAHRYSMCGGSIISDIVVLTAAHCTRNHDSFELGFGSIDEHMPAVKMTSTKKVVHENFNPSTLDNDMALLFLPEKLTFTDNIAPVELPSTRQKDTTFEGRKATVSGHGKTGDKQGTSRMLMYTHVKVISNTDCRKYYGNRLIKATTLCVEGWDNPNQATCQGDSGGPLVVFDDNIEKRIQVGVVSFNTKKGCEAKIPTAFARVSQYLDWINKNSGVKIRP